MSARSSPRRLRPNGSEQPYEYRSRNEPANARRSWRHTVTRAAESHTDFVAEFQKLPYYFVLRLKYLWKVVSWCNVSDFSGIFDGGAPRTSLLTHIGVSWPVPMRNAYAPVMYSAGVVCMSRRELRRDKVFFNQFDRTCLIGWRIIFHQNLSCTIS